MNYQIMLKNELEGFYKANAETKPNKGITGELRVLTEKIRQSTKADSEEMKQKKLASIQAKLHAGKKLTSEEMEYLRAADPEAYMHAVRIQQTRKSVEEALKHAKSKQEAQEIISSAVSSITKNDPDRDALIAAVSDVADKFMKSSEYQKLPATDEDVKKRKNNGFINEEDEESDNEDGAYQLSDLIVGEPSGVYRTGQNGNNVSVGDASSLEGIGFDMAE